MKAKSRVEVRLFLGLPCTKALQVELVQSAAWKRDMLAVEKPLEQVRAFDEEYLGKYVGEATNIAHLQAVRKEIYTTLHNYCPNFRYESLPCSLLPITLLT